MLEPDSDTFHPYLGRLLSRNVNVRASVLCILIERGIGMIELSALPSSVWVDCWEPHFHIQLATLRQTYSPANNRGIRFGRARDVLSTLADVLCRPSGTVLLNGVGVHNRIMQGTKSIVSRTFKSNDNQGRICGGWSMYVQPVVYFLPTAVAYGKKSRS